MKQVSMTVNSNRPLAKDVFEMILRGDTSAVTTPGQFVNIKIDGVFLRRPISVCDYGADKLTLIYKVIGKGTELLSKLENGAELDLLTGLGNGFATEKSGEKPLLIGGGVGVPPLYLLAKRLLQEQKKVTVILGFNSRGDVFYEKEFASLGAKVLVTTADGSYGLKGFVTDAMKGPDYSYFFTCGPLPMFRAIEKEAKTSGQYSFEERMACGFGACMGCSCETRYGTKRICKDGPVLEREEIIW